VSLTTKIPVCIEERKKEKKKMPTNLRMSTSKVAEEKMF
jgi:hypothetical protein